MNRLYCLKKIGVCVFSFSLLLFFCCRPVAAKSSSLELYVPAIQKDPELSSKETPKQEVSAKSLSAVRTSDDNLEYAETFLAAGMISVGILLFFTKKHGKTEISGLNQ